MPAQNDTTPVALSPATYERHAAAVEFVERSILTRDPRWGAGRFPGIVPGRWARLEDGDTITASSGGVLGGGSVTLCNKDGVPLEPEAIISVLNPGTEITTTGGPRIVRLGWTLGDWAVTCPGIP